MIASSSDGCVRSELQSGQIKSSREHRASQGATSQVTEERVSAAEDCAELQSVLVPLVTLVFAGTVVVGLLVFKATTKTGSGAEPLAFQRLFSWNKHSLAYCKPLVNFQSSGKVYQLLPLFSLPLRRS